MSRQHTLIQKALTADTWKEELSRAKRYKEATQRRREEKEGKRGTGEQKNRENKEQKMLNGRVEER